MSKNKHVNKYVNKHEQWPVETAKDEDPPKKKRIKITDDNYDEMFREAANLYMLGVGGDKQAVKDAIDLFKGLHSHNPENHLVEAYYGSVLTLIGRDANSPVEKFKNSNNGLKMIDHAVLSEPDNIEIRNLRANIGFKLPEMFFHRTGMAIEDFMNIASRYEADNTLFAPELYWRTLFNIGVAFKNLGYTKDSHAAWDKLLSVTSDPMYHDLVSKEGYKKK